MIHQLVRAQAQVRGWLVRRITSGALQNKEWRTSQPWFKGGRKSECEKYQVMALRNVLRDDGNKLIKTPLRLDCKTAEFGIGQKHDLFTMTENFDYRIADKPIFFNFKMVCEEGGGQRRTLRDLYRFIQIQYTHVNSTRAAGTGAAGAQIPFFVNILDGAYCHHHLHHFREIIGNEPQIYIGDLSSFGRWWAALPTQVSRADPPSHSPVPHPC